MHHTDTPFDDDSNLGSSLPVYVASFGLVLGKKSLLDFILFRRLFFFLNLARLVHNIRGDSHMEAILGPDGDLVIIHFQDHEPLLNQEVEFFMAHFKSKAIPYLNITI